MTESDASGPPRADWVAGVWSYLGAWGLPKIAVILGAFATAPARTAIWLVALAWMGSACIVNARRCGRVHCRYTGPFYLLLTVPVLLVGVGAIQLGNTAWFVLGILILIGGKLIWWITETMWGRYEPPGKSI